MNKLRYITLFVVYLAPIILFRHLFFKGASSEFYADSIVYVCWITFVTMVLAELIIGAEQP